MKVVNLLDWIENEDVREEEIQLFLSDFSCPVNVEMEDFLKKKSIDFARRKTAITYLILDDDNSLTGFVAITHKNITFSESLLTSKSDKKRMSQYAILNEDGDYSISAFLIAQLSRNFAEGIRKTSGATLLTCAESLIQKIQHMVGGRVIILEADRNEPKIIDFYSSHGYHPLNTRKSTDGKTYQLFLKLI